MTQLKFPTAWSYSRLSQYRKCPRQFFFAIVEKRPIPKAPAMERGTAVHDGIQRYIEGKAKALPKLPPNQKGEAFSMTAPVVALYKRLRTLKAQCELEYAVDEKWRPSSWFDPTTWLRAKLDARLWVPKDKVSEVYDHKTGKERAEEHAEQLEIYAAVEWQHQPLAEEVRASMVYADGGGITTAVFTDRETTLKRLMKKWAKEAKPMLTDRKFKATPGSECKWCPFSSRRGGPCDKG